MTAYAKHKQTTLTKKNIVCYCVFCALLYSGLLWANKCCHVAFKII